MGLPAVLGKSDPHNALSDNVIEICTKHLVRFDNPD